MSADNVVLFDGVCNLCNGWVAFLIARDPASRLRFASRQSAEAAALLQSHGRIDDGMTSILFLQNGELYDKSDATINILVTLGGPWRAARLLQIFPRKLRDRTYDLIARNRYQLFGRRNTCAVPTPDQKARFL